MCGSPGVVYKYDTVEEGVGQLHFPVAAAQSRALWGGITGHRRGVFWSGSPSATRQHLEF